MYYVRECLFRCLQVSSAAVSSPNRVRCHLELSKLEGASVSYLVSGREWRERRIRKSLQQSCHLHRAAADLYSLCRPLPLARSPPGAPNRVPGASSAAPATKNPPKVDNGRCDPISFWMPSSAQVTVRTNLQPGHMIDSKRLIDAVTHAHAL